MPSPAPAHPRRGSRRGVATASAALLVVGLTAGLGALGTSTATAAGQHVTPSYTTPSAVPAAYTPAVNNGQVNAITQVGSTMVVGGTFTSVTPKGGKATARSRLMAFDATTGKLSDFAPDINGNVMDLAPGPKAGTVYVAGAFTKVGTTSMSRVALLNVSTGAVVNTWKSPGASSMVRTLALTGGRLLIGGDFTKVGGQARGGLASLDPSTGAVTSFLHVPVTINHNDYGSGAQGPVGVRGMDVTPDGSKAVLIGNFKKVDGLSRDQLVILDLSGANAAVNGWRTTRYSPYCFNWAFDTYVRGVSVSPDGKWFVVTATGGPNPGTLCDAAARFEVGSSGDDNQPTWVEYSGGDTLWSVDTTDTAVFVGGHQRWMNNSNGADNAGGGSVARPGLAALDPETGLPLAWNPGRNPRGAAAFTVYATEAGVWVGSDTDYVGNWQYMRKKLAFFPAEGGKKVAADKPRGLPGTLYVGSPKAPAAAGSTLDAARISADGAEASTAADPHAMDWSKVRGAFMLGDQLYTAETDGMLRRRTFTTASAGDPVDQNPYKDPYWDQAPTGSGWIYEGFKPSLFTTFGTTLSGMTWSRERVFFTSSTDDKLKWSWFNADSGVIGSQVFTVASDVDWRTTAGLFADGDDLYAVDATTGALKRTTLAYTGSDARTTGGLTVVDSSRDWRGGAVFLGPRTVANQLPTPSFTADCSERTCTFDASASADPDGTLADFAWDLGDGETATGRTVEHTYASDGDFTATLTVTDDDGDSAKVTKQVSVKATPPASALTYVGGAATSSNSAKPSVTLPATVQPGDLLTLVGSYAVDGAKPGTPSDWNLLSSSTNTGMTSYVWVKWAQAGDAGKTITTPLAATTKSALGVVAHRGADRTWPYPAFAAGKDSNATKHTSPQVDAAGGAWVLQVYADKSSATTSWTDPDGTTRRAVAAGAGAGRASILMVDSGGPVVAGQVGGGVATADASSTRGISWTIVIGAAS